MEIQLESLGDLTEVRAAGRLDGHWSDHLSRTLDELIRTGRHRVVLRMDRIEYMSSIGIRVLVSAYKNFRSVSGSFCVVDPVENVARVLHTAGLAAMLMAPALAASTASAQQEAEHLDWGGMRVESHNLGGPGMRLAVYGEPERLRAGGYGAVNCPVLQVKPETVSLGLGAFGADFAQCRERFGEYLALAGAAICLPGDGSNTCDSLIATGDYTPEVMTLYGIACQGAFSGLLRFEPAAGNEDGGTPLSRLAELALERSGGDVACMVVVGESGGLVGASLKRSPCASDQAVDPLAFPAAREWLSMTADPVHVRDSVIVVAIVARPGAVPPVSAAFMRPLGAAGGIEGHAHAAAYRFRPLQRGSLDYTETVHQFVNHSLPETVLHLLADDRDGSGVLESLVVRGACWIAPIAPAEGVSR